MTEPNTYAVAFELIDKNGDGLIDVTEFQGLMAALGAEVSEDQAQHAIRVIDEDGDGLVTLAELTGYLSENAPAEDQDDTPTAQDTERPWVSAGRARREAEADERTTVHAGTGAGGRRRRGGGGEEEADPIALARAREDTDRDVHDPPREVAKAYAPYLAIIVIFDAGLILSIPFAEIYFKAIFAFHIQIIGIEFNFRAIRIGAFNINIIRIFIAVIIRKEYLAFININRHRERFSGINRNAAYFKTIAWLIASIFGSKIQRRSFAIGAGCK